MLVQALDLGDGGLDLEVYLGHMLAELLMLRLNPLSNFFEHLGLCAVIAAASATAALGHGGHELEALDLLAEL